MAHPGLCACVCVCCWAWACWACVSRGRLNNSVVVQGPSRNQQGSQSDPPGHPSLRLHCQGHGPARATFVREGRMDGYAGVGLGLPDCQVDSETAPWVGRGFVQSESRDEHPRDRRAGTAASAFCTQSATIQPPTRSATAIPTATTTRDCDDSCPARAYRMT